MRSWSCQFRCTVVFHMEGIFNNVSSNAIKKALTRIGLEGYLLRIRKIQFDLDGSYLIRAGNRGCVLDRGVVKVVA